MTFNYAKIYDKCFEISDGKNTQYFTKLFLKRNFSKMILSFEKFQHPSAGYEPMIFGLENQPSINWTFRSLK